MASTRKYTKTSVHRKTKLGMALLEPDSWIDQRIGNIRQYQSHDVQGGAQEDHGADDGEILRVDRVYGVAAQAGNAKKRLRDKTAHEQQRDGGHGAREYRQHGITQHMPKEHDALSQAFGTRCTHIVLAGLFQKQGAIKPCLSPQA